MLFEDGHLLRKLMIFLINIAWGGEYLLVPFGIATSIVLEELLALDVLNLLVVDFELYFRVQIV